MTAQQLIDILSAFQPETPVVVSGYESGYNPVAGVHVRRLVPVPNAAWYEGQLDHHESDDEEGAVYLYIGANR